MEFNCIVYNCVEFELFTLTPRHLVGNLFVGIIVHGLPNQINFQCLIRINKYLVFSKFIDNLILLCLHTFIM